MKISVSRTIKDKKTSNSKESAESMRSFLSKIKVITKYKRKLSLSEYIKMKKEKEKDVR